MKRVLKHLLWIVPAILVIAVASLATYAATKRSADARYHAKLQKTIAKTSQLITAVRPALLGNTVASDSDSGAIRLVARTSGQMVYVFSVNGNPGSLNVGLHVPRLHDGPATVVGENRKVMVGDHRIDDHFANPDVPKSAAWKTAANTPWTERMRPHFRDYLRLDCRRYTRR